MVKIAKYTVKHTVAGPCMFTTLGVKGALAIGYNDAKAYNKE